MASPILYDGFAYTAGTPLAGNGNWSALNTGTAPAVDSGNLLVDGLMAPMGGRVTWGAGNIQEAWNQFGTTLASGTLYFSLPFQLSAVPTGTTYSFGLAQNSTSYGSTVWLRADGADGFNIGLDARTTAPTTNYMGTKLPLNQTVFLVGSYEFAAGTANDVARLWVNPASGSFAAAVPPSADLTATAGTDLTGVLGFLLRGANGSPPGSLDEVRVGTTWADVTPVPEPAPAAGATVATLVLLRFARRHRRTHDGKR